MAARRPGGTDDLSCSCRGAEGGSAPAPGGCRAADGAAAAAASLAAMGLDSEAVEVCDAAIADHPGGARAAYARRAASREALGDPTGALKDCQRALRGGPRGPSARDAEVRCGRLYILLGRAAKAANHFGEAGKRHGGPEILAYRALAMVLDDRHDRALDILEGEGGGAAGHPAVLSVAARALYETGRYVEAAERCAAACRSGEPCPAALLYAGMSHDALGSAGEASRAYGAAAACAARDGDMATGIGVPGRAYALCRAGMHGEAADLLLRPQAGGAAGALDRAALSCIAGMALARSGRGEEAAARFREAASSGPENSDGLYYAGLASYMLGRAGEARRYGDAARLLRRALSRNKKSGRAADLEKRVREAVRTAAEKRAAAGRAALEAKEAEERAAVEKRIAAGRAARAAKDAEMRGAREAAMRAAAEEKAAAEERAAAEKRNAAERRAAAEKRNAAAKRVAAERRAAAVKRDAAASVVLPPQVESAILEVERREGPAAAAPPPPHSEPAGRSGPSATGAAASPAAAAPQGAGGLADARGRIGRLVMFQPDGLEDWAAKSAAMYGLGRYDEAAECAKKAHPSDPSHPDVLAAEAAAAVRSGWRGQFDEERSVKQHYDAALSRIARIRSREPGHREALALAGLVHAHSMNMGEMADTSEETACQLLAAACKADFDDATVLYHAGRLREGEDPELSCEFYRLAAACRPRRLEDYEYAGRALDALGRFGEARARYMAWMGLGGEHAETYERIAEHGPAAGSPPYGDASDTAVVDTNIAMPCLVYPYAGEYMLERHDLIKRHAGRLFGGGAAAGTIVIPSPCAREIRRNLRKYVCSNLEPSEYPRIAPKIWKRLGRIPAEQDLGVRIGYGDSLRAIAAYWTAWLAMGDRKKREWQDRKRGALRSLADVPDMPAEEWLAMRRRRAGMGILMGGKPAPGRGGYRGGGPPTGPVDIKVLAIAAKIAATQEKTVRLYTRDTDFLQFKNHIAGLGVDVRNE